MAAQKISEKERITERTAEYIEKHGIEAVTVRNIAKFAGVNIAAVNYYFGSKEELIREVLDASMKRADSEWLAVLKGSEKDPKALLKKFTLYCLDEMLDNPGKTKAHFYDSFVRQGSGGAYFRRINEFLVSLEGQIRPMVNADKGKDVKLMMVQAISAVMFPALFPEFYKEFARFDFKKKSSREKYVDQIISAFFRELQ